jgi:amino acid adenylation domain-containing protein/non-ribosomal peptide synthase protein (TIGR01720 family)
MADISKLIESLSLEKRKLLELKLKKQGSTTNTFPVSFAQQRLWFLDQLEPESTAYNIPVAVRLKGKIDNQSLEKSLNKIIDRHEVLRTTFTTVSGNPMQVVNPSAKIYIKYIDLTKIPDEQYEQKLMNEIYKRSQQPFNLSKGNLLNATMFNLKTEEHVLLIVMHHIISDGWSIGIFINEFTSIYKNISQNQPVSLPTLKIQYADYAQWQRKHLQGETLENQLDFWKEQLGSNPPVLELPTDYPRPAVKSYRGKREGLQLSPELSEELYQLSSQQNTTIFMTFLTVLNVILYRYSNQDDICIGTPIANRNRSETEGLIGFFVNTLVLRNDLSGNPTFKELLQRVRKVSLGAFTQQDLPFEMLVEKLQPDRSMSHTPLFQVMYVHQSEAAGKLQVPGMTIENIEIENDTSKFDLTFGAAETPDGMLISLEYDSDLFNENTIRRMLYHYKILLEEVTANPEQSIDDLHILTDEEKDKLLTQWVSKEVIYPKSKCIHNLFEEQAEKNPDSVAVVYKERQITYRELNDQANQLAHYLIKKGVEPDVLIGIYMEHTIDLLIALLGVLKAGGAYLPIDPVYPKERITFMLEDAEAPFILTQQSLEKNLPLGKVESICLDGETKPWQAENARNPQIDVKPDNLIYVIYTSGSTGKPKGTLITHYNVVRLFEATEHWFHFDEDDIWTLFHSFAFDFSVWEIWGALIYGGKLVIVPYFVSRSPESFYRFLVNEKVTVLNQTPSAFRQLIHAEETTKENNYNLSLRYIIFGGEALELNSLTPWFKRHSEQKPQLINMYGITETTVHVTYSPITIKDVEMGKTSVIGCSIPDLQVYILDNNLKPTPIGVPGEIHVGGAGLARGYLKRPELSSTKFVPNPFSDNPDARLYCSGDSGRFLANGDIEYICRIDTQVKVRGFRIELAEIERAIEGHNAVKEAVVLVKEDSPTDKRLVAFITPADGTAPGTVELRDFIKTHLPDYMIPSLFVALEAMPLTPNGKVDRKALLVPEYLDKELEKEFTAPRTPTEEIVAAIFTEVLNIKRAGSTDNFFELGGHSLLATQVLSRVRDHLKVDLPLRDLFQSPTIERLAQIIDKAFLTKEGIEEPPIVPVSRKQELPLSFAQQRLWFLDQLEPGSPFYNIPSAYRIHGELNVDALQKSLNVMVQRHESLRTSIQTVGGKAGQKIQPKVEVTIPITNLSSLAEKEREEDVQRRIVEEARKPFNLQAAPLFRTHLLRLTNEEHVLLLTMHHIISDAWSMRVFIREIAFLYSGFINNEPLALPEQEIQYADFALWQRTWLKGEVLDKQLNYWKKQLAASNTRLDLPISKPRPAVQSYHGAHISFQLDTGLAEKLRAISMRQGATLFMTILAAFKTLLYRYSGQDDINIGTPIANRNRSAIENIIGFFVNTLVMRTDLSGNPTFTDLLKRVHEAALGAYAHQDLPFEKLVEAVQPERDLSHTPLFQIMFVLQNTPMRVEQTSGIRLEFLEVENKISQFDLTLTIIEQPDHLFGGFEYNTDIFEQESIERMIEHFKIILKAIADNPDIPINSISMLPDSERNKLLVNWNDTITDVPENLCIHHLFERQAAATPEAIALIAGDKQLTYNELEGRANQLARHLRKAGIEPESRVGISVERSPEMIIGLLGILKAGAAYVPLDPNYPKDRLTFMTQDADIVVMLTQQHLAKEFPESNIIITCLDSDWPNIGSESRDPLKDTGINPQNTAYIIYTSGSTGTPKGVLVSHQSVVNHNLAAEKDFKLSAADRVLQFATINFDAAGEEIYPTLNNGGTLVLRGKEILLSGSDLLDLIKKHELTILDLPTAYWHQLVSEINEMNERIPESVRLVILGGDKASPERFITWNKLGGYKIRLLNTYGPTETTIVSTSYETTRSDKQMEKPADLPIGRPIANTQAYILNQNLQPVPIGIPGELHIGGVGLAHGYLKRPDLTAEIFIPNPFSKEPGRRLYKTGDLVYYRADGHINFIGRVDNQVKVRGFRVETGEIESALIQHPALKEATVIAREDTPGVKRLVAYYILKVAGKLKPNDRRGYLRIPFPGKGIFRFDGGQPIEPIIQDLSTGGLSITIDAPTCKIEQPVSIQLALPYNPDHLQLEGNIRWIQGKQIGIRFIDIQKEKYEQLEKTINDIIKEKKVISGELREFLTVKLPDYMIPAAFVPIDELPYTPSGKIDRKALPLPDDLRPELKTEYVEAKSYIGKTLSEIWQDLLGLKKVGINDNFFELGGDSILSIQFIARAKQKGIQITPVQMFKYQTIAELTAFASTSPLIEAEQGIITGGVPLTPIQRWFFEQPLSERYHWNQSIMLQISKRLDHAVLEKVILTLSKYHDALRLCYKETNEGWKQINTDLPESAPFHYFDLSSKSLSEQKAALEEGTAQLQASLNLSSGSLIQVAYFDFGQEPGRLLIIIHHLAIDGVSWRILIEDFQAAYQQILAGQETQLPPKTTSFKHWAEKLIEYSRSEAHLKEMDYWISVSRKPIYLLPVNDPTGENTEQSVDSLSVSLNENETKALLQDVPAVYNTQINDILLTALVKGFSRWTGKRSLLLNMEGHGREDIIENIDLSRTIGWFTSLFPVYLDLGKSVNPGETIKTIKEQLHQIPNKGVGFGILRYLSSDEQVKTQLSAIDHAQVTFNYLGQFDQALPENSPFGLANENKGADRSPKGFRSSLIDITGGIGGGKLGVSFSFSKNIFRKASIDSFANGFISELRGLIEHCNAPEAGGFTASDFQLVNLDNKKLDKVMAQLQNRKKKIKK